MPTINLTEAKTRLTKYINEAQNLGEQFLISRNGRPVAVLMSYEEYDSLLETLDVLSDEQLMADIKAGEEDIKAGRVIDHEELLRELEAEAQQESGKAAKGA